MRQCIRTACLYLSFVILWFFMGCDIGPADKGLQVMFDGQAQIYRNDVYYFHKVVGKITSRQRGNSGIEMMTIELAPEFKQLVGSNWAFFVENGRIAAVKFGNGSQAMGPEDKLNGFQSKAALNWFKFKTLLNDRAYRAALRAEGLYRRSNL